MLSISILTLFPAVFDEALTTSILGRAAKSAAVQYQLIDLRQFGIGKQQVTDDHPYGGGPGMVMMIEPIDKALSAINAKKGDPNSQIILLSARGKIFNQTLAKQFAQLNRLILICGHYQDVDQRVAKHLVDLELSVGNFVLTGGEPAALVTLDAVTRLLPGVLGNSASLNDESHQVEGEASSPQYTRPDVYRGWSVPDVLLSGDHQKIQSWREQRKAKASSTDSKVNGN